MAVTAWYEVRRTYE